MANYFAGSPEFLAADGALDDVQYVTLLYRNVLGRERDEAGPAGWVGMLAGGTPRLALIDGFIGSVEYRARFLP